VVKPGAFAGGGAAPGWACEDRFKPPGPGGATLAVSGPGALAGGTFARANFGEPTGDANGTRRRKRKKKKKTTKHFYAAKMMRKQLFRRGQREATKNSMEERRDDTDERKKNKTNTNANLCQLQLLS
jgi:hypothetical protein